MNKNKKGFTLLELLVVVLIIGILAAIALPKYQLAVDKSRFAKLRTNMKVISEAYKRYYLLHNDYPTEFQQLDVDIPDVYDFSRTSLNHAQCAKGQDIYCCMIGNTYYTHHSTLVCGMNDYSFAMSEINPQSSNEKYCVFKADSDRAKKLCNNITNKIISNSTSLLSPDDWQSGYASLRM